MSEFSWKYSSQDNHDNSTTTISTTTTTRTSDHVPSEYEASFLVYKTLTLDITVAMTDSCFI